MSSSRSPRRRRGSTGVRVTMIVAGVLLLVAAVAGGGYAYLARTPEDDSLEVLPSHSSSPTPTASAAAATVTPTSTAVPSYAATGPNTFVYADGQSAVFGIAGGLRAYRVAIETGTPVPVDEFAAMVDNTLSDERSWIAGKNVRLQRVGAGASSSFTVYLVTPGTAQRLCNAGGFDIFWRGEPYTSCRVGARVVINISRYLKSVPDYGAPLESYQRYAINHEVGHALGHDHELCPGKGKPAPVMQQQTFDLQGCVAYFWPYLDGKRYAGPAGRIVPKD